MLLLKEYRSRVLTCTGNLSWNQMPTAPLWKVGKTEALLVWLLKRVTVVDLLELQLLPKVEARSQKLLVSWVILSKRTTWITPLEINRQLSHLEWLLRLDFKEDIKEMVARPIVPEDWNYMEVISVDQDSDNFTLYYNSYYNKILYLKKLFFDR
jgi:hypothetical protein